MATLQRPNTVVWVKDQLASNCFGCQSEFSSFFNRRHHCRRCGGVFCGKCSSNNSYIYGVPQRVCDRCYNLNWANPHQMTLDLAVAAAQKVDFYPTLDQDYVEIQHELQESNSRVSYTQRSSFSQSTQDVEISIAKASETLARLRLHPDVNTEKFNQSYIVPLQNQINQLTQEHLSATRHIKEKQEKKKVIGRKYEPWEEISAESFSEFPLANISKKNLSPNLKGRFENDINEFNTLIPQFDESKKVVIEKKGLTLNLLKQFLALYGNRANHSSRTCAQIIKEETVNFQCSFIDFVQFHKSFSSSDENVSEIGIATHFVCHCWDSPIDQLIDSLNQYSETHLFNNANKTAYFWIDIFCINQHKIDSFKTHFQLLLEEIKTLIEKTNNFLIFIHPWSTPVCFCRTWCLYEISCALKHSKIELIMSKKNSKEFENALLSPNFEVFLRSFETIDLQNSQSFDSHENRELHKFLLEGFSISYLEDDIKAEIRRFLISKLNLALRKVEFEKGWETSIASTISKNLKLLQINDKSSVQTQTKTDSDPQRRVWETVSRIRSGGTVVYCLTNLVSLDLVVNGLLSIGATPITSFSALEMSNVFKLVGNSKGILYVNFATPSVEWYNECINAIKYSKRNNVSWVLDPVAGGLTTTRKKSLKKAIKILMPILIRTNTEELLCLAELLGVETRNQIEEDYLNLARKIAQKGKLVIVLYGNALTNTSSRQSSQFLTDGDILLEVSHNDFKDLISIAAGRSLVGGLISTFIAQRSSDVSILWAAAQAISFCGICSDIANKTDSGSGSFRKNFIDALYDYSGKNERIRIFEREWTVNS
eukprot:c20610_g1_i1.p1 GENE.c20610_g1_i1~~c20610_g1_i1.p1  ORF type:complete len:824 (+),score=287.43 c20610_g1_i1:115-2586(+)